MTGGWAEFWNRPHRIYANERHRAFHYRRVADDLIAEIARPDGVVLDFGCGDALDAERVAGRCDRLLLCDAAPGVRHRLAERYREHPRIEVVAPDALAVRPRASIDLILMNSVTQYVSPTEFRAVLDVFRALMSGNGRLVIADVIPPHVPIVADVGALLRTAWAGGFVLSALAALIATFFSDYRRLRATIGLTRYDEGEFLAMLAGAGFTADRRPANLGFHPGRMTFDARALR